MSTFVKVVKPEDLKKEALHISIVSCGKYITDHISKENIALHTIANEAKNKIANSVIKYAHETIKPLEECLKNDINPVLAKGYNPPIMAVLIIDYLLAVKYESTCLIFNKYKQSLLELTDILLEIETDIFLATVDTLMSIVNVSPTLDKFKEKALDFKGNKNYFVDYGKSKTTDCYHEKTAFKIALKFMENIKDSDFDIEKDFIKLVNKVDGSYKSFYGRLYQVVIDDNATMEWMPYIDAINVQNKAMDDGAFESYLTYDGKTVLNGEYYTVDKLEKPIIYNVLFKPEPVKVKPDVKSEETIETIPVEVKVETKSVSIKDDLKPNYTNGPTVDVDIPVRRNTNKPKREPREEKPDRDDKELNILLINYNCDIIDYISNNDLLANIGKSIKVSGNVSLLHNDHGLYEKLSNEKGKYDLIFIEKGSYAKIKELTKLDVSGKDLPKPYLKYIMEI